MQYSKPMIELVFAIRRFVSSDLKPSIKLANPDLFSELQRVYNTVSDAVIRALIKELFHLAGSPWPNRLEQNNEATPQSLRVYRGGIQLIDKPVTATKETPEAAIKRKTRIYRGQVVVD